MSGAVTFFLLLVAAAFVLILLFGVGGYEVRLDAPEGWVGGVDTAEIIYSDKPIDTLSFTSRGIRYTYNESTGTYTLSPAINRKDW